MTKSTTLIKLLLVDDSVESAEQIISILRNGGIAVRPARASNEAELEEAFGQPSHAPDLIVVSLDRTSMTIPQIREISERRGRDSTLIVTAAQLNDAAVVKSFQDGARAAMLRTSHEHVQIIVKREYEALAMRRSVRRLEASLRESERRADALLDSSRDPIAFVHEGMHVRANKAYLDMFGYETFEDIEGVSILDMIAAPDADDFKSLLKRLSKGEKPPQRLNLKAQRADGSTFDAAMEFAEASFEGEPCQQITFRLQASDPDLHEKLDELRAKDLVTDLFNRTHMLTQIDNACGLAANGTLDQALLLVEPDGFRAVLDSIGIGSADLLLGDMATLLRKSLREGDIAGRVGDHLFAILLHKRDAAATNQFAETLRSAFAEHIFEIGKKSVGLTASLGGVLLGEKNANATGLMNDAAAALRQAQTDGGNRAQIHDPSAQDKAAVARAQQWLKAIDDALANDGFVLYHQPIIALHGAEGGGDFYEILLRMNGPNGEILPGHFLPIAERSGRMPAIDRWVIAKAIRAIAERERAGNRTTFFIKLTPQSLEDQTLVAWIAQQLKSERQRGDSLVFEMPESKVVTSLKQVHAFARALEQIHCNFALEQFGAGLNSFQLLKHVPARYLKIDRHYMADLPKQKENQDKVKEICNQAHQLGKLTVAEFVEDAASMSILFGCGVNFVQGNFLQEPEKILSHAA
ncbi:MAG: EAL domain-containing protein [Dokdonella sp.]|nr:EAL domain-containing protein [Dokdonella sp.]